MNFFTAMELSASGMLVQKTRTAVIAENLANAQSTRSPDGGPYKPKSVVIGSTPVSFEASLDKFLRNRDVQQAQVLSIEKSNAEPKQVYDPTHPDADENGFISLPDVNATQEMIDMLTASRSYQANMTVLNSVKAMVLRTFELGV